MDTILDYWPGEWFASGANNSVYEASCSIQTDNAYHRLGWQPRWDFSTTIARTVGWYRSVHEGASPIVCCLEDLNAYNTLLVSDS